MSSEPKAHRLTAPAGSAFEAFFRSMEQIGAVYAGAISGGAGGKWNCPNPDHADEHASLDVHAGTGGKAGKPVATCTPCREAMGQREFWSLLVSLGVEFRGQPADADAIDWGPAAEQRNGTGSGPKGATDYALVAAYDYRFFDGSRNFKVRRLEDKNGNGRKTFSPQRWDEDKAQYVGGHGALDKVLRTPLFFERFEEWADDEQVEWLWLTEGEKAATAIVERGRPASCFHGGTAGRRMDDWTDAFKRFKLVRVWTDLDEAGLTWAKQVVKELREAGIKAEMWCNGSQEGAWVPKGDAFEQITSGGSPQRVTPALAKEIRALHPMPVTARPKPQQPKPKVEVEGSDDFDGAPITDVATPVGTVPFNPNVNPQSAADWWLAHTGFEIVTQGSDVFYERVGDHFRRLSEDELDLTMRRFWNGRKTPAADPTADPVTVMVKRGMVNELIGALGASTLVHVIDPGAREYVSSRMVEVPVYRPVTGFVPFRNGLLDVATGRLLSSDETADVFNTWRVPADFTSGEWERADSLQWVKFLESLGWDETTPEYRLLRQVFGWVLSGETRLHKIAMLIGPKRAGKGTILKVLQSLMGDGAVGFDLGQLDEQFGLQNLLGRSLAIDDDARFDTYSKRTVGRLLRISSFGISDVNVKNKPRLSTVLPVRMMVATNEAPKFNEASDALAGRFVVLKLKESFYGREDAHLDDKLAAEAAGIAKWAIEGYADLVRSGLSFAETEAGAAVKTEIADMGNQVRQFVEDTGLRIDTSKDAAGNYLRKTPIADVYATYQAWAVQSGNRVLARQSFVHDMLTAYPECERKKLMKKGTRSAVWCLAGVWL